MTIHFDLELTCDMVNFVTEYRRPLLNKEVFLELDDEAIIMYIIENDLTITEDMIEDYGRDWDSRERFYSMSEFDEQLIDYSPREIVDMLERNFDSSKPYFRKIERANGTTIRSYDLEKIILIISDDDDFLYDYVHDNLLDEFKEVRATEIELANIILNKEREFTYGL